MRSMPALCDFVGGSSCGSREADDHGYRVHGAVEDLWQRAAANAYPK